MSTIIQTIQSQAQPSPASHRSLDLITQPLSDIARQSVSLIASEPGRFELAGQIHHLPRYLFLGPPGGAEPMRIGIFAGLHGDEGVLRAPPTLRSRPFEVILETPHHAPQYLQEAAFAVALCTILEEYRRFIAHAQNL